MIDKRCIEITKNEQKGAFPSALLGTGSTNFLVIY